MHESANIGELLQLTDVTESIKNIILKIILYEKVFWGKKNLESHHAGKTNVCVLYFLFSVNFLKDVCKAVVKHFIVQYIAILLNIGYIVNITPLLTSDLS